METSGERGMSAGTAHHPARVWLDCLQLLKLFNLALIHVVLQLPGAVLVRQRAPLDQVVHHLLQAGTEGISTAKRLERGQAPLFIIFTKAAREPIRMALGTLETQRHHWSGEKTEKESNVFRHANKKHAQTLAHGYDLRIKRGFALPLPCLCPHNTTPPALGLPRHSRG